MAADKSRTYAFVQKLENLPEDWLEQFESLIMPSCYIVHNQDEAEPHVHFLLDFNSPVRATSVIPLLPSAFGVLHVEPVRNRNAYQRYMLHIGQEGKHVYDLCDLKPLHGCKVNQADIYNVEFADVYHLIEENDLLSFAALVSLCVEHYPQLMKYITTHVQVVRSYIQDRARVLHGSLV